MGSQQYDFNIKIALQDENASVDGSQMQKLQFDKRAKMKDKMTKKKRAPSSFTFNIFKCQANIHPPWTHAKPKL